MASDLLQYCLQHGQLPKQYLILEPCAQLRTHQQKHLKNTHPQLFTDESPIEINWIETIPEQFSGIIVANEVLDAMPVQMVRYQKGWQQMMVGWRDEQLIWSTQSCDQDILEQISALNIPETEGYTTEINRQGPAWLQSLAEHLSQGLILLIDYGMPKSSYYHPQRNAGTLRCHWQHHAHDNPLLHPGGQDITAHVDFTTLAEAGMACGLDLLGYCHQAGFLLSLGLHEMPEATDGIDNQLKQSQQIKQLTLPSGMGELFKAIAFGKNIDSALQGFQLLDQRDQLFTESASH